jgi:hypothetical protein
MWPLSTVHFSPLAAGCIGILCTITNALFESMLMLYLQSSALCTNYLPDHLLERVVVVQVCGDQL